MEEITRFGRNQPVIQPVFHAFDSFVETIDVKMEIIGQPFGQFPPFPVEQSPGWNRKKPDRAFEPPDGR